VTAEEIIQIMLEFDQQQLTSRPSPWSRAAATVQKLLHSDYVLNGLRHTVQGNYFRAMSLKAPDQPNGDLDQPTVSLIGQVDHWRVKAEALHAVIALVSVKAEIPEDKLIQALVLAEAHIRANRPIEGNLL
jgi:hypothetical protein